MELEHSYLYDFIFEACQYFSKAGYICNPAEIYEMAGKLGATVDIKRLLQTTIVHSSSEYDTFHLNFDKFVDEYFHDRDRIKNLKESFQKNREKQSKKIEKLIEKQETLQKELEKNNEESAEYKKALKTEQKQNKIPNLEDCLKDFEVLRDFVERIHTENKPNHEQLMNTIKIALRKACNYENSIELMKAIKERGKQLSSISNKNESINYQISNIKRSILDTKQAMEYAEDNFKIQLKEIVKNASVSHRPTFTPNTAKNAVRSTFTGEHGNINLDKDFSKMTEAEKNQINYYIKDNARKFRTKLSRKIRTNNSNKLDMPMTIKKCCQTGGIPLQLMHQKPVRQKSNLVLILDVSGSCKDASEMMLVFMHAMKEVFPGGCKTYAFTNKLYDISQFFDIDDATTAAKEILGAIPRSGAYSNYEKPFATFYKEHMSDITSDSYVYFIGDARNNKNPSGVDYVKAIARKAKKAFWLNTEDMKKWDQGDSIMSTYAKYMTKVVQAKTPSELLGFLEG